MTRSARAVLAEIRTEALSVDELLAAVRTPEAGAVVVFVGQVRNHDDGRSVEALSTPAIPARPRPPRP